MFWCPFDCFILARLRSVNLLRSCVLSFRWTSSPALIRKHWKKNWKSIEHESNYPALPSAVLRKTQYPVRYGNSQVFCSLQTLFSLMYWWRAFVLNWSLDSSPDRKTVIIMMNFLCSCHLLVQCGCNKCEEKPRCHCGLFWDVLAD